MANRRCLVLNTPRSAAAAAISITILRVRTSSSLNLLTLKNRRSIIPTTLLSFSRMTARSTDLLLHQQRLLSNMSTRPFSSSGRTLRLRTPSLHLLSTHDTRNHRRKHRQRVTVPGWTHRGRVPRVSIPNQQTLEDQAPLVLPSPRLYPTHLSRLRRFRSWSVSPKTVSPKLGHAFRKSGGPQILLLFKNIISS
jgi:hypothetical protein